jgi:carboxypeptidase Q
MRPLLSAAISLVLVAPSLGAQATPPTAPPPTSNKPVAPSPVAPPAGDTLSIARRYRAATDRLIDAALGDTTVWQRLGYLTDTFGARFSGTKALEDAIDWTLAEMKRDGLDAVRGEPVMVPHWVRGRESLEMVAPRRKSMTILGLGGSVGTPAAGITAPVLVVSGFDELHRRAAEAKGKIVLFDVPFTTYGETVTYRGNGATEAAKAGAVAALVRSVTPRSLDTPHTGGMRYDSVTKRIPVAAVTVEDAELLHRMQERGQRPTLTLKMEARTLPDARSRNVVAELRGRELPDEIVVMGGHIDSWDVGQGAMDDAGGVLVAWEAIRLMKALGLRPRRTIRVVGWTNEENGLAGGRAYRDAHRDELANHVLAIESDGGVFRPQGFGFTGSDSARALVRQALSLLDRVGAGRLGGEGGGADIGPIMALGVPGAGLQVDGTEYFWYHHTNADTMDKLDVREVQLCVAAMAVLSYVVADMPERLPRVAAAP